MKTKTTKFFSVVVLLCLFLAIGHTGETMSVGFFNLDGQKNFPDAAEILQKILNQENPDIAIFAGIKDREALNNIGKLNTSYTYSFFADSTPTKVLALISKIKPTTCELKKRSYKIKNDKTGGEEEIQVLKGFIDAKFAIGKYEFTLLVADLKDREPDAELNQFDMRRYEARQLRYIFDEIIKVKADANIIVVGNFNDTCEKSTIKEIYARKYKNQKRLFDLRPIDDLKTSWTHWEGASDEYERSSYALSSYSMLPEILTANTRIVRTDDWLKLSSHRPLIISFRTEDMQEFLDKDLANLYPNCIYSEQNFDYENNENIGEKPKRKSPSPPQPTK
jgi:hypothetical protein